MATDIQWDPLCPDHVVFVTKNARSGSPSTRPRRTLSRALARLPEHLFSHTLYGVDKHQRKDSAQQNEEGTAGEGERRHKAGDGRLTTKGWRRKAGDRRHRLAQAIEGTGDTRS